MHHTWTLVLQECLRLNCCEFSIKCDIIIYKVLFNERTYIKRISQSSHLYTIKPTKYTFNMYQLHIREVDTLNGKTIMCGDVVCM
jgi:hypothetical protein